MAPPFRCPRSRLAPGSAVPPPLWPPPAAGLRALECCFEWARLLGRRLRRMDLLRGGAACARAMARLGAVRSHYCALLLAAALAVCAFYYLGSGRETFSSATKRLKEARAGAAAPTPPVPELARGSAAPASGAKAKNLEGGLAVPVDYHLLMMFTKAEHNAALQAKARVALRSLLRLAKFEPHEVLNLHFVSEEASREVAKALLRELLPPAAGFKCKVRGGWPTSVL